METMNKKVIIIAVILALFSSFLIFAYIQKATVKTDNVEYINVYVAAKTMSAKHQITEEDLKQVKVTREYLNSQAMLNKADIIGKRLKDRVIEGEQILKERILGENNLALAFNIPEGKRAVSVNVNEQIAVGNMVRPGDFVDVIATFQKDEMEDKTTKYVLPAQSKITIQNVQVLALSQDQSVEGEKVKEEPKTVTLAVTPEDAEKLVFCSEFASIRLALRPVGDNNITNTSGVIRNDAAAMKGLNKLSK